MLHAPANLIANHTGRPPVPYDESLAQRVRELLGKRRGFVEKKMFGGTGFLRHGDMCAGVWQEYLIVRVGPEHYKQSLAEPGAKKFDITGRAMTGWVMVVADALVDDDDLADWIGRAERFVTSLPDKAN
jgi:TfoX/Sxy family transcriptional regulator of competence genes